jgi:hypothetical protein
MAGASPGSAAYFLEKYGDRTIACTPYALAKLGLDKNSCVLKVEGYSILCIPYQFNLKRSLFIAALSPPEHIFLQTCVHTIIGLSISLTPPGRAPAKFLLRCTLDSLGQVKGREKVGVFAVDFKAIPVELTLLLGGFLQTQDRLEARFEEYGDALIKMSAPAAKHLGYKGESVITEAGKGTRKIRILSLSSNRIEHTEDRGTPLLRSGTPVAYEIYLKKSRLLLTGVATSAEADPLGPVRTVSSLNFSPELVEIIEDYWYTVRNSVKIVK